MKRTIYFLQVFAGLVLILFLQACQGVETTRFEPQWLTAKHSLEEHLRQEMSALDVDIQGVYITTSKEQLKVLGVVFEMPESYELPAESTLQSLARDILISLRSQVADSLSINDMTFRLNRQGKEIFHSDFKF